MGIEKQISRSSVWLLSILSSTILPIIMGLHLGSPSDEVMNIQNQINASIPINILHNLTVRPSPEKSFIWENEIERSGLQGWDVNFGYSVLQIEAATASPTAGAMKPRDWSTIDIRMLDFKQRSTLTLHRSAWRWERADRVPHVRKMELDVPWYWKREIISLEAAFDRLASAGLKWVGIKRKRWRRMVMRMDRNDPSDLLAVGQVVYCFYPESSRNSEPTDDDYFGVGAENGVVYHNTAAGVKILSAGQAGLGEKSNVSMEKVS